MVCESFGLVKVTQGKGGGVFGPPEFPQKRNLPPRTDRGQEKGLRGVGSFKRRRLAEAAADARPGCLGTA